MLQIIFFISICVALISSNTECFWAIGRVTCALNQSLVIDTVMEVWDKDGPKSDYPNFFENIIDGIDADDKAGVNIVDDVSGLFNVEGCASDQDWLFVTNTPEFYFRVRHRCTPNGSQRYVTVRQKFKTFVPNTYDKYMNEPLELSTLN